MDDRDRSVDGTDAPRLSAIVAPAPIVAAFAPERFRHEAGARTAARICRPHTRDRFRNYADDVRFPPTSYPPVVGRGGLARRTPPHRPAARARPHPARRRGRPSARAHGPHSELVESAGVARMAGVSERTRAGD